MLLHNCVKYKVSENYHSSFDTVWTQVVQISLEHNAMFCFIRLFVSFCKSISARCAKISWNWIYLLSTKMRVLFISMILFDYYRCVIWKNVRSWLNFCSLWNSIQVILDVSIYSENEQFEQPHLKCIWRNYCF